MDKNIGVGLIIGLVSASSLFVYNSDRFTKLQKTILLIALIFPPAQWLGIIGVLLYNNYRDQTPNETSQFRKTNNTITNNETQIEKLSELKNNGILSEEEYIEKVNRINNKKFEYELKLSEDYINLKSLYDNDVLTKEEFENKILVLKQKSKLNQQTSFKNAESAEDFRVTEEISEGYYVIIDENFNYGFADKNLKKIIDTNYEFAESFKDGLALVRLNGKFGFINSNNETIIPIEYDEAKSFENGTAEVKKGKEVFHLDKFGQKH